MDVVKAFEFGWTLHFVTEANQVRFLVHSNSVFECVRLVRHYYGSYDMRPVPPWALFLNFTKRRLFWTTRERFELQPEHFARGGALTPEFVNRVTRIDGPPVPWPCESICVEVATGRPIPTGTPRRLPFRLESMARIRAFEPVPAGTTLMDVIDVAFGNKEPADW